jgi:hypothetical protein
VSKEAQVTQKQTLEGLFQSINTSKWQDICRFSATRYFKAFSNPNLEESFLDGWRLFENISGHRNDPIEKKILRVSSVFKERMTYKIIGKHLALRRNLISHGHRIDAEDNEALAFQILNLINFYLYLLIQNPLNLTP